jgi:hypothetical protein
VSNDQELQGIDRLFAYMETLYGAKFADLWRGTDIAKVKLVWEQKLAPFSEIKGCMRQALAALDERPFPPTLPEFIALCRDAAKRIGTDTKRLTYTPSQQDVDRLKAMAKQAADAVAAKRGPGHDFKSWAKELRAMYQQGQPLSAVQQRMASEALDEVWMNGTCKPIEHKEAA